MCCGVCHRDIKLENILLDADGNFKLADFGLAIDRKHELANTRLGTFGYFAPEVLDCPLKSSPFEGKEPSSRSYNTKVDVWSAGVLMYELMTGKAPFVASSAAGIIEVRLLLQLYPAALFGTPHCGTCHVDRTRGVVIMLVCKLCDTAP